MIQAGRDCSSGARAIASKLVHSLLVLGALCGSTAGAASVPRQIVADFAPYPDAQLANADAAHVDWRGHGRRQDAVTLAWAALELDSALKSAGVQSRIVDAAEADPALPEIVLRVIPSNRTDAQLGDQGFRIGTSDTGLTIEGNTRIGVLYGTYRVLERLGFRWFSPNDRVVPADLATRNIAWSSWREAPATRWRGFWIPEKGDATVEASYAVWMARNRLNLGGAMPPALRAKLGLFAWNGGHRLLQEELSAPGMFADHPDWYALIGGKRQAVSATTGTYDNPSFVSEGLANYIADRLIARLSTGDLKDTDILAVWPSDGRNRGWDESAEARAVGNNTDNLLLFYTRLQKRLAKAVADGQLDRHVTISGISYNDTWELPTRTDLVAQLAASDYVHVYYNPERSFGGALTDDDLGWRAADGRHVERLAAWKTLGHLPFGINEYYNDLNYAALPVIEHQSMRGDFQLQMRGGGLLFSYFHPFRTTPGPFKLTNWLLAHVAWRGVEMTRAEYEAWVADYFALSYGDSAGAMRTIHDELGTAASNAREIFLRVSLKYLLFEQQRSSTAWTPRQVSDLANAYLAGGRQWIPAPRAESPKDLVRADFIGLRESLALLETARKQLAALPTQGVGADELARRHEVSLWADAAWQRYELLRIAVPYYRELNLEASPSPITMKANHDRIVELNRLLAASIVTNDTVSPLIKPRSKLYPPEWLLVPGSAWRAQAPPDNSVLSRIGWIGRVLRSWLNFGRPHA